MAKTNAETKSTEPKAASNKIPGPKVGRKPRGEGAQVSISVDSRVWKVLHSIARIQGTRVSLLLAQNLGTIMEHENITLGAVEQFLKGTQKPQAPKEVRSEVLDRLFGAAPSAG